MLIVTCTALSFLLCILIWITAFYLGFIFLYLIFLYVALGKRDINIVNK